MFYRNTNDSKHNNIRIVSLAAGLALATAAVIGGSDLLKENNTSKTTSPVTPRVERTTPQFGTMAEAVFASQGIASPSQFGTMADAVHAVESIRPQAASVDVNNGSHLGLGQPTVGQSFANMADAVYAAEGLLAGVAVPGRLVNAGDAFGLGQPGEGNSAKPQFGTMADADFASR